MEPHENGPSRPRSKSGVAEEWLDEEVFLYDQGNGDLVQCLNSGAALIWVLCDGNRDVEGIAGEIATTFDLHRHEVLAQVQETVAQFELMGLLESMDGEP